jgi:hypothetical protein
MPAPRLVFYHLGPDDPVPDEVKGQPRTAVVLQDLGTEGMRLKVFLDPQTDGGQDFLNVVSRLDGSEPGQWSATVV